MNTGSNNKNGRKSANGAEKRNKTKGEDMRLLEAELYNWLTMSSYPPLSKVEKENEKRSKELKKKINHKLNNK